MMSTLATIDPASSIAPELRQDLQAVNTAVAAARSLAPQGDSLKARKGQEMNVVDKDIDVGDFQPLPERPDESMLQKISVTDLLPPPASHA